MSGDRYDPEDLRSPRLRLRPARRGDVDQLIALNADPLVMRYIKGAALDAEETAAQLEAMLAWRDACPTHGYWVAEALEDGAFCGWVHLRPDRWEPELVALGYRLPRRVWGQGYATEAARLLCEAGGSWGEAVVVADALVENQASQRVMQKCGMQWRRDLVYSEDLLPGWPPERRRGVQMQRRFDR